MIKIQLPITTIALTITSNGGNTQIESHKQEFYFNFYEHNPTYVTCLHLYPRKRISIKSLKRSSSRIINIHTERIRRSDLFLFLALGGGDSRKTKYSISPRESEQKKKKRSAFASACAAAEVPRGMN